MSTSSNIPKPSEQSSNIFEIDLDSSSTSSQTSAAALNAAIKANQSDAQDSSAEVGDSKKGQVIIDTVNHAKSGHIAISSNKNFSNLNTNSARGIRFSKERFDNLPYIHKPLKDRTNYRESLSPIPFMNTSTLR